MKQQPIRVMRDVAPDHPALAGHFPGAPLLPGAALLSEVLEAILDAPELAARIGNAATVEAAKFLAPARPGDVLCIALEAEPRAVRFEVTAERRTIARGRFTGER